MEASDGNKVGRVKVTVTVTDVEETGKVTWTVVPSSIGLRQFRSGASLTAVVTDPDRATATATDENITTPRYYVVPVVEQVGYGNGDRNRQHLHRCPRLTLATTFVWWRATRTQTAILTAATDARK